MVLIYQAFLRFLSYHRYAIFMALIAGCIAGLPQVIAREALGSADLGIPYLVHDSEGEYLSRINEILDGHPSVSSPVLYEYKNSIALMPPSGELLFYVLPMKLTGLSLSAIIFLSRFFYPAFLFFLVYLLIFSLLNRRDAGAKISAIAGSFLIVIGYNLVDYRGFISYLIRGGNWQETLVWDRLVNPITGAILLFAFLWLFLRAVNKKDRYLSLVISALILAVMSGYIFSLALGLTISVLVGVYFAWRRNWPLFVRALIPAVTMLVFNAAYFSSVFLAMGGGFLASDPRKSGMFLTHVPTLNMISIITLAAVLLFLAVYFRQDKAGEEEKRWWWFSLATVLASVIVYSQQIITGRTVSPQHFVQFTTPLNIAVAVVFLHNIMRFRVKILWWVMISLIFIISAISGWRLLSAVPSVIPQYADLQSFAGVINYLNANAPPDCVVYVSSDYGNEINRFIPGLTSCNVYHSFYIYNGVPADRVMHNFLVNLRLRGIAPAAVDKHLDANRFWAQAYFFRDWNDMFCCRDKWLAKIGNKKEIDQWFVSVKKDIERQYVEDLSQDLYDELIRYRLDYFVVDVTKQPQINKKNFPFLAFRGLFGRFAVYAMIKPVNAPKDLKI